MGEFAWDDEEEVEALTPEQKEYISLGWRIIEWKLCYYYPEMVHPSRKVDYEISDEEYDLKEQRYLELCRILNSPNSVVHKRYPGFEDVSYDTAMQEVDFERPSVQLVAKKLGSEKSS